MKSKRHNSNNTQQATVDLFQHLLDIQVTTDYKRVSSRFYQIYVLKLTKMSNCKAYHHYYGEQGTA